MNRLFFRTTLICLSVSLGWLTLSLSSCSQTKHSAQSQWHYYQYDSLGVQIALSLPEDMLHPTRLSSFFNIEAGSVANENFAWLLPSGDKVALQHLNFPKDAYTDLQLMTSETNKAMQNLADTTDIKTYIETYIEPGHYRSLFKQKNTQGELLPVLQLWVQQGHVFRLMISQQVSAIQVQGQATPAALSVSEQNRLLDSFQVTKSNSQ